MSFLQPFYDFLLFVSAKKEKKSRTGQKNNSFYELFKKKYDMLEKEDSQCLLEKAGSTRLEKVLTNVKVNFAVVELSRLRAALVV